MPGIYRFVTRSPDIAFTQTFLRCPFLGLTTYFYIDRLFFAIIDGIQSQLAVLILFEDFIRPLHIFAYPNLE